MAIVEGVEKPKKDYGAKNITVLKGLDPVKTRPGMYTNTENPNHIVEEVIDNSIDEALTGNASKVVVTYKLDKKVVVEDDGRGIPVDMHEEGVPAVQLIFTKLHAGGKFDSEAYDFSGGLHGVGVSVTNALSDELNVEVKRDGQIHNIIFNQGEIAQELTVIGECDPNETGTKVTIVPTQSYFDDPDINIGELKDLLQEKAVLLSGLNIHLIIEKEDGNHEVYKWFYDGGIESYLNELTEDSPTLIPVYSNKHYITEPHENSNYVVGDGAEFSIVWDSVKTVKKSFVNMIPTPNGGTHVVGFRNGLFEAVKSFADMHSLMPKNLKISADDIWGKATFILSSKVSDPQFQGQTKDKLNNRYVAALTTGLVKDHFEKWLHLNVDYGKALVEMAIEQAKTRTKKATPIDRKQFGTAAILPDKLTDCNCGIPEQSEIFIVEGDSAGGSAKQGRNKDNQAIITLKGKPLNTWLIPSSKIFENQVINDLSLALGIDPHKLGDDVDWSKLRYHNIIVLSDADKDGFHIQVLLIALFFKHFPQLIEKQFIKIAQPPLYKINVKTKKKGEENHYVLDEEEKEAVFKKLRKTKINIENDVKVTRFKGLGEMNAEQLAETSLNPDFRRVETLIVDDWVESEAGLNMLLNKKEIQARKDWVYREADFSSDYD